MAILQGFPSVNTPFLDENGNLTQIWFQFLQALWLRTGAAQGASSDSFLYPSSNGNPGQVLTSRGDAANTIWTTPATKTSQLTNDSGYITTAALAPYSTTATTETSIETHITSHAATTIPNAASTFGSVGTSTQFARADHVHPQTASPSYTTVTAATFRQQNGPTWTSGPGAPPLSPTQPNGSLYSRTDGITGSRLYVSNGSSWAPVANV